jgi:hypothetical protein
MKINRIQKHNVLNVIDVGYLPEGYRYTVSCGGNQQVLEFQLGERNVEGSIHGLVNEDLLEIVRHRLQGFQQGKYACRENALALTAIEEALLWLNKRTEDRASLGILGINKKGE